MYMRKEFSFLKNSLFLFIRKIGANGSTTTFIGGNAKIIDP